MSWREDICLSICQEELGVGESHIWRASASFVLSTLEFEKKCGRSIRTTYLESGPAQDQFFFFFFNKSDLPLISAKKFHEIKGIPQISETVGGSLKGMFPILLLFYSFKTSAPWVYRSTVPK